PRQVTTDDSSKQNYAIAVPGTRNGNLRLGENRGRATVNSNPFKLSICEKGDVPAVRRPEGRSGVFRSGQSTGREFANRSNPYRSPRIVSGGVRDKLPIGRYRRSIDCTLCRHFETDLRLLFWRLQEIEQCRDERCQQQNQQRHYRNSIAP